MFFLFCFNIWEIINYCWEFEYYNMVFELCVEECIVEFKVYLEELVCSNCELEDFVFVVFYDFQELLWKICVFGNWLSIGYQDVFDECGQDFLVRMFNVVECMLMLISDLLVFLCVIIWGKDFVDIDFNEVVLVVLDDLEIFIEEIYVKIMVDIFFVMRVDLLQMN